MNVEHFLNTLPSLYFHWGAQCLPITDKFSVHLSRFKNVMTTAATLQLLNHAVACLGDGETYLEIGCYRGCTLLGAMLGHDGKQFVAVDNFSEFDGEAAQSDLREKLKASSNVALYECDFEQFLSERTSIGVGAFFYDGAHDYRSTLMALLLASKHLSDRAVVILDDWNFRHVQQAGYDFLAAFPQAWLALELPTTGNGVLPWWNGVAVLGWNVEKNYSTPSKRLADVARRIYEIRDGCA